MLTLTRINNLLPSAIISDELISKAIKAIQQETVTTTGFTEEANIVGVLVHAARRVPQKQRRFTSEAAIQSFVKTLVMLANSQYMEDELSVESARFGVSQYRYPKVFKELVDWDGRIYASNTYAELGLQLGVLYSTRIEVGPKLANAEIMTPDSLQDFCKEFGFTELVQYHVMRKSVDDMTSVPVKEYFNVVPAVMDENESVITPEAKEIITIDKFNQFAVLYRSVKANGIGDFVLRSRGVAFSIDASLGLKRVDLQTVEGYENELHGSSNTAEVSSAPTV